MLVVSLVICRFVSVVAQYHLQFGYRNLTLHALYDRQPPTAIDLLRVPHDGTTIPDSLSEHTVVIQEQREHFRRTRQQMCDQANRHRTDHRF